MLSHLHKCFDARLISIHPKTHLVRAFVNYDILVEYHGQKAKMPRKVDERALQHHWDMCCLENTPEWSLPFPRRVVVNVPNFPSPLLDSGVSQGDPSKVFQQTSSTQASNTREASGTQAVTTTQASRPTQASAVAPPPSPPLSEPGLEGCDLSRLATETIQEPVREQKRVVDRSSQGVGPDEEDLTSSRAMDRRTLWRLGGKIIEDPAVAQQLMGKGWLLEVIHNDEKYSRGRSREERRCVASEEDAAEDLQCTSKVETACMGRRGGG